MACSAVLGVEVYVHEKIKEDNERYLQKYGDVLKGIPEAEVVLPNSRFKITDLRQHSY